MLRKGHKRCAQAREEIKRKVETGMIYRSETNQRRQRRRDEEARECEKAVEGVVAKVEKVFCNNSSVEVNVAPEAKKAVCSSKT